nr:bifunctional 5,10-methylenetetrahydrofolate dehydrogenase/5,10-methenyltetrahydrofolate cyclohydrolase [Fretibacterium sp.]
MAILMKGAEVAAGLKDALTAEREKMKGLVPRLAVVRVGARKDDLAYERGLLKRFESLELPVQVVELPEDIGQGDFDEAFGRVNSDPTVSGVLLFRPLPNGLSDEHARQTIDPRRDVDGMSPVNVAQVFAGGEGFAPCTPSAVMELLAHYGVSLEGKSVAIAGRSLVVGRPLAMLMLAANATVT